MVKSIWLLRRASFIRAVATFLEETIVISFCRYIIQEGHDLRSIDGLPSLLAVQATKYPCQCDLLALFTSHTLNCMDWLSLTSREATRIIESVRRYVILDRADQYLHWTVQLSSGVYLPNSDVLCYPSHYFDSGSKEKRIILSASAHRILRFHQSSAWRRQHWRDLTKPATQPRTEIIQFKIPWYYRGN